MENIEDKFKPKDKKDKEDTDDSDFNDSGSSTDYPSYEPQERGEPKHHFLGLTEYDLIDFSEGFASGIYQKDVKEEYELCIIGVPRYAMEIYNVSQEISIAQFTDISSIMANIEELQDVFNILIEMITEAPDQLNACKSIYGDVLNTFNWIMHHLSPT